MKYCEDYAALLDAFVDGELSQEEMDCVQEHLGACGPCDAYVADALALRAAFPVVEDTVVPEGFADAVCAAIRADAAPRKKSKARWLKAAASLAACAAIVLAASRIPFGGGYQSAAGAAGPSGSTGIGESRSTDSVTEAAGAGAEAFSTGGATSSATQYTAPTEDGGLFAAQSDDPGALPEDALLADSAAKDQSTAALAGEEGLSSTAPASADSPSVNTASASAASTAEDAAKASFHDHALAVSDAGISYDALLADLDGFVDGLWNANGSGAPFQTEGHTENGSCVAWYGQLFNTPHTSQYSLWLYFADGNMAVLPLPSRNFVGTAPPASMAFDGGTFTYEVVFTEDEPGMPGDGFVHVKGTYRYTVDLSAKTVSLEILQ